MSVTKEIIKYLITNPNPSDDELHKWAEGKGFNIHDVEEIIYRLASRYVLYKLPDKKETESAHPSGDKTLPSTDMSIDKAFKGTDKTYPGNDNMTKISPTSNDRNMVKMSEALTKAKINHTITKEGILISSGKKTFYKETGIYGSSGQEKEATFYKRFRELEYWDSRNTSTRVSCDSFSKAKAIIKKSGVKQKLVQNNG